jgi:hypothetical protein
MIGGTPSLAKSFFQLLNATDATYNEADKKHNHFVFEDKQNELRHLLMNGSPVSVDQPQCMAFLMAGVDPLAMREDPIINKK